MKLNALKLIGFCLFTNPGVPIADGTVFCARRVHALHVKYTVRIQGSTVSESVGGIGMHKCESLLTVDEFSLLFVMYRPASLADACSNGFRIEL